MIKKAKEKKVNEMVNFVNTFLSYVVLTLVFAAVMGVSVFAGIFLRKRKNAKMEQAAEAVQGE